MDIDGGQNHTSIIHFYTSIYMTAFVNNYRWPKYHCYIFIVHNALVFDNYIMLKHFLKQASPPNLVMKNSRIILMYDMYLRGMSKPF